MLAIPATQTPNAAALLQDGQAFDTFSLLMGLFGGLALFLFGLDQMSSALKAAASRRIKAVLARLTTNRFIGVLTGTFVTAVIQSSSVTTVLVVGFISAGLMSLAQSMGIILGADIGTTITAQIIAFKVTEYALLLVAIGFCIVFFSRRERIRRRGSGIMGLGLVFYGMSVMGEAMAPLRGYEPFLVWMTQMENPLLGILAGATFTAVVQSSSATTGVVIMMASQGLIQLPAGIALIFGANIGTCITALLAALGKPREAMRAAVVHIIFKVIGVLLWVFFIDDLGHLVVWISPQHELLADSARLAAESPRQIANAHTIFNVANTLVFLPFTMQFARLVEWLVPDRPELARNVTHPKYLDLGLLDTPSLALDRARLEILHMSDGVKDMLRAILPALVDGTHEQLSRVAKMDDKADILHGHIVTYLGAISQRSLTEDHTDELLGLMETSNDLENIGDIIEMNLVGNGAERIDRAVIMSAATRQVIREFHAAVVMAYDNAIQAVSQRNSEAALAVIGMKRDINRLAAAANRHQAERLVAAEPKRLAAYTVETDILENLKRIYYFCKRMARIVVPTASANSED